MNALLQRPMHFRRYRRRTSASVRSSSSGLPPAKRASSWRSVASRSMLPASIEVVAPASCAASATSRSKPKSSPSPFCASVINKVAGQSPAHRSLILTAVDGRQRLGYLGFTLVLWVDTHSHRPSRMTQTSVYRNISSDRCPCFVPTKRNVNHTTAVSR
jgi:hypothetical protein